jgi:predicted alpha/beta-hydrolase family hydrolase
VHAPWALGLAGHPAAGPAVPVTAVVAHTAAAVLLTVILSCVDAILAALCTAAARLAAALPGRRRTGGDGRRPVPEARHGGSAGGRPRTRPPRGPPVLVTT